MTLNLSDLSKTHGQFKFGPFDLRVEDGVLAVLGPSGSGKTTLLSLIAGITEPDSGSICLNGRELVGHPLENRDVGMVFQEGALFPHMTARENIAYAATTAARVGELAATLEIEDILDRSPPVLSGGEYQRVALARTLATDPAVLLLDEPLSSLDTPIRRRLRDELHSLFESLDIPILYVTHDQRTATALGDRIAIVRDGMLEQVGDSSTVVEQPATEFVARFTGNENLFEGSVVEHSEKGVTVRVGDVELQTATSDIGQSDITVCIHPSRVEIKPSRAPDDEQIINTITGTVIRWLNEGSEYQIEVATSWGSSVLTASVHPPTFERLTIDTGTELQIMIPPSSIHLMPNRG